MNLDKLNQWLTLLANIGVLLGIILLAFELHQNNEFLEAQVRASRAASSQGTFLPVLQSQQLAEALAENQDVKAEKLLKAFYFQYTLIGWQYSWGEYKAGALEEKDLPVEGWITSIISNPGFLDHWSRVKRTSAYDPDFMKYIDMHLNKHLIP